MADAMNHGLGVRNDEPFQTAGPVATQPARRER
jgi:hypothetical protein